ncbi:MAG: HEAT repeat domain-containing protein [bacterium]|nr:HEAT repeat domain-containing protein [bacterium]
MSDLSDLLGMAKNSDPSVRAMVAQSIATIPDPAATTTLIDLLSDADDRVRLAAIYALGASRKAVAIEPLLPLLDDEEPVDIRCATLAALAMIADRRSFAPIAVRLFDVNDEIRKNAAAAIGRLRDGRALEPLLMCLDDEVEWVRANAALSLGQLGRSDPIGRLAQLADSEDTENVRSSAISALGSLGAFLIDSEDAEEQEASARALDCAYTALDDAVEENKVRVAAQISLADGFERIGQFDAARARSIFALACAISSDSASPDDLRSTAIWSLGKMATSASDVLGAEAIDSTVELLIAALDDPHEWCVRYAIEALANIGGERAKEAVAGFAASEGGARYSELCAKALDLLGQ